MCIVKTEEHTWSLHIATVKIYLISVAIYILALFQL